MTAPNTPLAAGGEEEVRALAQSIIDFEFSRPGNQMTRQLLTDKYTFEIQALIAQRERAARDAIVNAIANPEFVYELMNAPTNGAGVDMIKQAIAGLEQEGSKL